MSKWVSGKEEIFNQFKEQKRQEQEQSQSGPRRSEIVWKTPEKGTSEKPKIYQGRLLFDPNDIPYRTFYYHMYQDKDGNWCFVFCPKSWDMKDYCPFCAATMRLYKGTASDRRQGYKYKRKIKHCANWYVGKDPRDTEAESNEEKNEGKVFIYEFPSKVESKIRQEMDDKEYGNGINIFDPGEDGVDFILKVGATKPIQEEGPNQGKVFPDYSNSKFAPKSNPLSKKDEVIEKIMEQRHDLTEYLKSMMRSDDDLLDLVKSEPGLWELIEQDYSKPKTREPMKKVEDDIPAESELNFKDTKEEETTSNESNETEKDLLAELEGL